jgi:hypothetical protein
MTAPKLGEKMYRSMTTDDFYDECWFDEASKDEMKSVEPVHVFTPEELRKLVAKCYTDGVRMQGGLALSVSQEELNEMFKELGL